MKVCEREGEGGVGEVGKGDREIGVYSVGTSYIHEPLLVLILSYQCLYFSFSNNMHIISYMYV